MKLGVVIDGPEIFIRDFMLDWKLSHRVDIFSYAAPKSPFFSARLVHFHKKLALKRFLSTHETVFFEWAGPLLILASQLRMKTRIVTRLHSWELFEFAPQVNWESVDNIILVGNSMQQWFTKQFPLQAHKTSVIYNGVCVDKFTPNYRNNGGVIGMLGNLLPIKRVYELVLVLHELRSHGYNFSLLLGGPAPKAGADDLRYYAALQRMVNILELDNQVVFCGVIENPEVFLNKIDIFVSNSFWESQHVALAEAMSSGCYCLGHAWDGIRDILPEENIFFTNTELIEKIINYWQKPEAHKKMEREILQSIARRKFDIELLKPKMREIIEKGK
jgi:glycosyltransferase involved in cell wall biosynthesis